MAKPHVYTLPGGVPFLPALAQGLRERLGDRLQDTLILLPTRRAVRELGNELVGDQGASLLPRMRPLADIDPDEPPFEPGYLTGLVDSAMPAMQRRFALAEIMDRFHENTTGERLDPSGCLAMADPLLAILDDAAMEELDISRLDALDEIEAFAARHFQNAAELYRILQKNWPKYLSEQGYMEPMARRVALLKALTALWTETPPDHPVVIAGSTGTLKATARLIRCVAHMEQGMVVLPGLDKSMPDVAWQDITDDHPQKSLENLIRVIGIERGAVSDWDSSVRTTPLEARRRLISESLVPVKETADWPGRIARMREGYREGDIFADGVSGLSLIEARSDDEEALCIALALRETLQKDDRTAALITPDPALARRVKARLRRWNVDVDYSQGEPLEETAIGGFLTAILALATDLGSPLNLAELFTHPLTALNKRPGEIAAAWRVLERQFFRGVRPPQDSYQEQEIIMALMQGLGSLADLSGQGSASASDWAAALTQSAEALAGTDTESGRARLWVEDAGEKAAGLLEELIAQGGLMRDMTLPEFAKLLSRLMRGRVVRPRYGTHPRLQILGPLEARMLSADVIILGGLNEGVWPAPPPKLPFLSRGMRRAIGLSLPERRFGLAAHDFSILAAHKTVILTRSQRSDGGPTVASRWIWRLKTLLKGAFGEAGMTEHLSPERPYADWARSLDNAETVIPAPQPRPAPPIAARWPKGRKLSITRFKTWVRDPYAIYARYVLRLEPLDPLEVALGPSDYGKAIHGALEHFVKAHPKKLPANARERLSQLLADHLIDRGYELSALAREQVRLDRMAEFWTEHLQSRRAAGIETAAVEAVGRLKINALDFTLTGKADLIERSAEGYVITDYKTGVPASAKVVAAGFDLQLPITAMMIEDGGFKALQSGPTAQMRYIRLKGSGQDMGETIIHKPKGGQEAKSVEELVAISRDVIEKLVTSFDRPETGYPSQPRIQYVDDYGDYDDLARRGEWARLGEAGTEGLS